MNVGASMVPAMPDANTRTPVIHAKLITLFIAVPPLKGVYKNAAPLLGAHKKGVPSIPESTPL